MNGPEGDVPTAVNHVPTLSVPALASLAIFQFLWVWNDLLVALVYLQSPNLAPMTLTINNLVSSFGTSWQLLTAAAFISMMLPLVVFWVARLEAKQGFPNASRCRARRRASSMGTCDNRTRTQR